MILFFFVVVVFILIWMKVVGSIGICVILVFVMGLVIVSFGWVVMFGGGEVIVFVIICIGLGFVVGVDMLILLVLFFVIFVWVGL